MLRCSRIVTSCTRCFSTVLRSTEHVSKICETKTGDSHSANSCANYSTIDPAYAIELRKEKVDELFSIIDRDAKGVVSKSEFKNVVGRIGSDQINGLRSSMTRNLSTYSFVFERKEGKPTNLIVNDQAVGFEIESQHLGWRQALAHRFKITAEVMVSKIFPAGFAWQGSSILAENWGMSADSFNFALTTGIGDGLGVLTGHTLFMAVKKAVTGNAEIDIGDELQTGILLGSAAFCSGTAWQPVVNALTATGSGFNMVVTGTTIACGLAFFGGLRLARSLYPQLGMTAVEPATYSNLKTDATLSLSIGGATGAFVGTDISFGCENWLRPTVGIEEGVGALNSMVTAGGSTALGFTVFQGLQNITFPRDKSWLD